MLLPVIVMFPRLSVESVTPEPWTKFRAFWLKLGVPLVLRSNADAEDDPAFPRVWSM
jgi:hypothetical protein